MTCSATSKLIFIHIWALGFLWIGGLGWERAKAYRLETRLDTNACRIGESFQLFLRLKLPPKTKFFALPLQKSLGAFEVLETWQTEILTGVQDSQIYTCKLKLSAFDTGKLALPPLPLVIQTHSKEDTLFTPDLFIKVGAPAIDPMGGLFPLKGVMQVPLSLWSIALGSIVALFALYMICFLWRKIGEKIRERKDIRRKRAQQTAITESDAWQTVWRALKDLEQRTPTAEDRSAIIAYYGELIYWIRFYLEKEKAIPALKLSTPEIVIRLQDSKFPEATIEEFYRLARLADQVKFAKALPPPQEHLPWLETARSWLLNARNLAPPGNTSDD